MDAMIKSFANAGTEDCFNGNNSKLASKTCPSDLQKKAKLKLALLDKAEDLDDLRLPPGNRLEALVGDRKGQHSIRINGQYRVCFEWTSNGPFQVEIVDYH